ncbi:MAG: VOC family protein [Boseongicola sp.]|nr:MAG: VOC family protein [Boseongicola sp.]
MKPRISMIALGVSDLAASVKFYEAWFGVTKEESPPTVAFLALNGSWLGLTNRDALAGDAGLSPEGTGFAGINMAHNVASEAEVDAVVADAEAAGGTVVKAPVKADWGGYHAYVADPDGHLWDIAYNPFVWIGPKDE